MRSIWTGSISFGLVNIPVRLYSAVGENNINFDMLSKRDLSPIKYSRISLSDGKEVPYKDIVKGYEIEKGQYIVMEEKDFQKASAEKSKSIEIVEFVLEEEIDPVYFDKPYYLEPDKNAGKPYALLREALKTSKKVGVAKFVLRNREHIAILKPSGNVIVLNQLRYDADIRDFKDLNLPGENAVGEKEVALAMKLIDQLSEKFKPSNFKDTYVDELKKIIDAKAEGKTIKRTESKEPQPTKVKDLMDTLMASLNSDKSEKLEKPIKATKSEKKPVKNRAPLSKAAKEKKAAK